MNRLTNAFSSAIPSANADLAPQRTSTPPIETHYSADGYLYPGTRYRLSDNTAIYDDPRTTHYAVIPPRAGEGSTSASGSKQNTPRRRATLGAIEEHETSSYGSSSTPSPASSRSKGKGTTKSDTGVNGGDGKRRVRLNLGKGGGADKREWGMSTIPGTGKVTSMARGPDGKYAVGGGQYLRILQLHTGRDGAKPDEVTEVANLWKGNWGVSKSINDLDWGSHQFENKLVSATPSGNLLVFDVHRTKLDREVNGGHPRPINVVKLCKSPSHGHLLITGGTEGQAKVWDLRDRDPRIKTYFKHSVPITSLELSPESPHHFMVGLDNGSIQRYDMRYHNRNTGRNWGAHGNKAVMDLKWKGGDGGGWLASAGEDKTVQIWDMSQSWDRPPTATHTLHASRPLRKISWRPDHDTELAIISTPPFSAAIDPTISSIPQGLQATHGTEEVVEIWDVRRHYVAKYAVPSSDGTPINVDWRDSDTLVAGYSNAFAVLDMEDRVLPIDDIPRQVVSWNRQGDLGYALDKFKPGEIPFDDLKAELVPHWDRVGKQVKSISDQGYDPVQAVGVLPLADIGESEFEYLASHYRVEGSTPHNLCLWNRSVAELCERHDDARLWTFLKSLLDEFVPLETSIDLFEPSEMPHAKLPSPAISPHQQPENADSSTPFLTLDRLDNDPEEVEELLDSSSSDRSSEKSSTIDDSPRKAGKGQAKPRFMSFAPPTSRQISDVVTKAQIAAYTVASPTSMSSSRNTPRLSLPKPSPQAQSSNILRQTRQSSSSSEAKEDLEYPDPYGVTTMFETITPQPSTSTSALSSSIISTSATPRSNLTSSRINTDTQDSNSNNLSAKRPGSGRESPRSSMRPSPIMGPTRVDSPVKRTLLPPQAKGSSGERDKSRDKKGAVVPSWASGFSEQAWAEYKESRCAPFLAWWEEYINGGEVQLATAIMVVGQSVLKFPMKRRERIVSAYLDLLESHRLDVQAAYIRQNVGIPSLEIRPGDDGITHIVKCSICGRSTGSADMSPEEGIFWWCKRCKREAKNCVICHRTVKGLYLGCRRCKHGGHQKCMRLYYLEAESSNKVSLPTNNHLSDKGEDRPRTSGETNRSSGQRSGNSDGHGGGLMRSFNTCPAGCECYCRSVLALGQVT